MRSRACVDRARECAEHGDLLGARGAQVLFQQRAALVVEAGRRRRAPRRCSGRSRRRGRCARRVSPSGAASASASVMCAAGSVVESVTSWPRSTSASAIAAASVVLPTPPLPIVMTTPLPAASSSSTSASRPGRSTAPALGPSSRRSRAAGAGQLAQRREPGDVAGDRARRRRPASLTAALGRRRAPRPGARRTRAPSRHRRGRAATPLITSRWLRTPSAASSPLARAASRSALTPRRERRARAS